MLKKVLKSREGVRKTYPVNTVIMFGLLVSILIVVSSARLATSPSSPSTAIADATKCTGCEALLGYTSSSTQPGARLASGATVTAYYLDETPLGSKTATLTNLTTSQSHTIEINVQSQQPPTTNLAAFNPSYHGSPTNAGSPTRGNVNNANGDLISFNIPTNLIQGDNYIVTLSVTDGESNQDSNTWTLGAISETSLPVGAVGGGLLAIALAGVFVVIQRRSRRVMPQ